MEELFTAFANTEYKYIIKFIRYSAMLLLFQSLCGKINKSDSLRNEGTIKILTLLNSISIQKTNIRYGFWIIGISTAMREKNKKAILLKWKFMLAIAFYI